MALCGELSLLEAPPPPHQAKGEQDSWVQPLPPSCWTSPHTLEESPPQPTLGTKTCPQQTPPILPPTHTHPFLHCPPPSQLGLPLPLTVLSPYKQELPLHLSPPATPRERNLMGKTMGEQGTRTVPQPYIPPWAPQPC